MGIFEIILKNAYFFLMLHLFVIPPSCETAGQKFGGYNPTKVVNQENAEIDDISVIREGDHLFLLQNECETIVCDTI